MFRFKGVVPPMITPFTESGEVDYASLKTLVEFLSANVDGLFVTGSYGSAAMLSQEERKQVLAQTVKTAGGRIPVVAHVGTADSLSAADLAAHAAHAGAAAVSAVGPFYYKHNADSIMSYYDAILKAANGMPVYVYNNPQFQGYTMDFGLIEKLKSNGVSGVKDATFDIITHANYLRRLKDDKFDIALGTEAMWLSACVLGCEAFIPGLGNAFPEICAKMYKEGVAGDFDACRETQFVVNEMRDIMYIARSTQLAIYAMLEIRDIIKACPRAPFLPATDEEKKQITARIKALNLL